MTAALRSALAGDRAPLLRLVAEALGGGTDAGSPFLYSEGLDAAVACHDYPQLYDMTAPPGAVREQQYAEALRRRTRTRPATYGPFTVREYARSDWQALDWCTRWPVAAPDNPAGPPTPEGGSYSADVPVLVLSGELDSITTAAEGDLVAGQFPQSQHVVVRNSFHVTAISDTDGLRRAPRPRLRPHRRHCRSIPTAPAAPSASNRSAPRPCSRARPRPSRRRPPTRPPGAAPSGGPRGCADGRRPPRTGGGTTTPATVSACAAAPGPTAALPCGSGWTACGWCATSP